MISSRVWKQMAPLTPKPAYHHKTPFFRASIPIQKHEFKQLQKQNYTLCRSLIFWQVSFDTQHIYLSIPPTKTPQLSLLVLSSFRLSENLIMSSLILLFNTWSLSQTRKSTEMILGSQRDFPLKNWFFDGYLLAHMVHLVRSSFRRRYFWCFMNILLRKCCT